MRTRSSSLLVLLALATAGAAVPALPQGGMRATADAVFPPQAPAQPAAATLMLTVRIDATGVGVLQATRKPNLEYRAPRDAADAPFQWVLRDAAGTALAAGGFDPAELCLDPAHAGQPPHVRGDVAIPHVTHTNVKVPDLPFARVEFQHGGRAFGSVVREAVPVR